MERLSGGEIRLEGKRIDGASPEKIAGLGIAHVPEGRRVFPMMTVRENLEMGAYLRKDATGATVGTGTGVLSLCELGEERAEPCRLVRRRRKLLAAIDEPVDG